MKNDHPLFGGGAPARIIHCLAVAHRVDFDHLTRFFVKIVKKQGLKSSTFIYPRPERKNVKRQGSKRSSKAFFLIKRAGVIIGYIYYLKNDHPLFGGGAPARIIHCLAVAHRVDFDHLTRFFVKIVKKQGLKSSTFIYPRPERKNVKRQGSKRSSKAFFLWDNKKISGAKKEEERQTMQIFNDFLARFVV